MKSNRRRSRAFAHAADVMHTHVPLVFGFVTGAPAFVGSLKSMSKAADHVVALEHQNALVIELRHDARGRERANP